MSTTASIVVPTRGRPAYLDAALASIAPQAELEGAEVIVVEDGEPLEASRRAAERHGARYLAHGAPIGINTARNTGIEHAGAPLVVFVDDDVLAGEGWLRALLAGAAAAPGHDVLGGPIEARLDGGGPRSCGREGPPITYLDLGPGDRDAERVWGANMAVRRRAFERHGRFDPALDELGCGDEEDWLRRYLAAGGRIRYVAGARLVHRREGADARLRGLARVAYRRGRGARRYDAHRGVERSTAAELGTLAACLGHAGRRRCAGGLVGAAHAAGRLREALARGAGPAPGAGGDPPEDFLSGASGTVGGRRAALRRAADAALDARTLPTRARLALAARRIPPRRRVLVLGVRREDTPGLMDEARAELGRSRHEVEVHVAPAGARGKFENLNALLAAHPAEGHDWLLVVDDDVALPRGFLDGFLLLAERFELALAQPAHRLASHAAWDVTRRRAGSVARETRFVEIGPVTAFHADTFTELLPFPPLRMGWGLDAHWSALAHERGWRIGVIDLLPVGHTLRPAGAGYPREEAIAEARAFLARRPYVRRADAQRTLATHRRWR